MVLDRRKKRGKRNRLEGRVRTYTDPEDFGLLRQTGEGVPHAWREAARGHSDDAQQVQPEHCIVYHLAMVGEGMVDCGQRVAYCAAEEIKPKYCPVVQPGLRVVVAGIRVEVSGQRKHPEHSQEVAIDVAGFIVDIEEAPEAVGIGVGDGAEAGEDALVVLGPWGQFMPFQKVSFCGFGDFIAGKSSD